MAACSNHEGMDIASPGCFVEEQEPTHAETKRTSEIFRGIRYSDILSDAIQRSYLHCITLKTLVRTLPPTPLN